VNDGATASGNGVAVLSLLELSERTGKPVYRERAEAALRAFAPEIQKYPGGAQTLALAVERASRRESSIAELARSVVDARIELSPGAEWSPFVLTLSIRKGWHVNGNPPSSPYLIPTEIKGDVRNVAYPESKSMTFSFSDEALLVYDGEVSLRGEVRAGEASVTLVYQACDDTRCLAPVERILEVGLRP
jgi:hypothetical protein